MTNETMCPNCNSTDALLTGDKLECFNCEKFSHVDAESQFETTLEELHHKFVYITFGDELPKLAILMKDHSTGAYMASLNPADMFYPKHVVAIDDHEDEAYPHIVVDPEQGEVE